MDDFVSGSVKGLCTVLTEKAVDNLPNKFRFLLVSKKIKSEIKNYIKSKKYSRDKDEKVAFNDYLKRFSNSIGLKKSEDIPKLFKNFFKEVKADLKDTDDFMNEFNKWLNEFEKYITPIEKKEADKKFVTEIIQKIKKIFIETLSADQIQVIQYLEISYKLSEIEKIQLKNSIQQDEFIQNLANLQSFDDFESAFERIIERIKLNSKKDKEEIINQIKQSKEEIIDVISAKPTVQKKKKKNEENGELLNPFFLLWSIEWKKKWLKKINLRGFKSLDNFLLDQQYWGTVLQRINKFEGGKEWINRAFHSIRMGSKGLFQGRFLDHALISVPPPVKLFEQITDTLMRDCAIGIAASSGWGKSRLALWIAFGFSLKKWKIIYFSDTLEFNQEEFQIELLKSLKKGKILVIIDNFNQNENDTDLILYWRNAIRIAEKNQSAILFIQTIIRATRDEVIWPIDIPIISENDYYNYWSDDWIERFEIWYHEVKETDLEKYIFPDQLTLIGKSVNPWSFVSIMVNLQNLIKNHLPIQQYPDLIATLTIIIWGYAISEQKGLTSENIYTGLSWVYKNQDENWKILKETGGKLWPLIEKDQKDEFLNKFQEQLKQWRQSPKDSTEIRLLPDEGSLSGYIHPYHVDWWKNAFQILWENDPDWKKWVQVKKVCEIVIIHSSSKINGKWITVDKSCEIFGNCHQLKILKLGMNQIIDLDGLKSCTNLEVLNVSGTKIKKITALEFSTKLIILNLNWAENITDLTPLSYCKNLQELYLNRVNTSDFSPLKSCENLQKLYLNRTKISNLAKLGSLKNLQELRLSDTKIKNINHLEGCSKIKILDISTTDISDIKVLKNCTELEKLDLNWTKVYDISALKYCVNLQVLDLNNTKVRNLSPLKSCINLKKLYLSGTEVEDISPLKSCVKLQILELNRTKIKDIGILTTTPNLRIIDEDRSKEVTNILILTTGNDGQDKGVEVLEKSIKGAGMKVKFENLTQDPEQISNTILREKMDVLGFIIQSKSEINYIPNIIYSLRDKKISDILISAGGVIPEEEREIIKKLGVTKIFLPGTRPNDIIEFIRKNVKK